MLAVKTGQKDIVKLLLANNATLDLSNRSGQDIFDLAKGNEEMLAVIQEHQRDHLNSVMNALPELCAAMTELRQISEHLLERIQTLLGQSKEIPTLTGSSRLYADIINTFHSLLKQHSKKLTLERLVSARTVVGCLRQLRSDLDTLLDQGILEHHSLLQQGDWQTQWEQDERNVYKNLVETLENDAEVIQRELSSTARQEDILKLLKYEAEEHGGYYSKKVKSILKAAQMKLIRFTGLGIPELPNWFLPEYEVQRQPTPFAHGSLGSVFRGTWLESQVVIKCVDPKSEEDKRTFRREAKIWQKARHRHVVNFFGACDQGSPWFFDLKCNQILVSAEGVAMLTDFGLSFMSADSRPRVPPGGGVRWKAPECLNNSDHVPTKESDVYSFGMCVVEAVTGDYPWRDCPDLAVVFQVKRGLRLPRPRYFVDNEKWQFVQALCATDPSKRLKMPDAIRLLKKFADQEQMQEWLRNADNQDDV